MAVSLAGLPAKGKGGDACYPFEGYVFDTAVPAVHGARWPRRSAVRGPGGDYVALSAVKKERAAAKRARRAKTSVPKGGAAVAYHFYITLAGRKLPYSRVVKWARDGPPPAALGGPSAAFGLIVHHGKYVRLQKDGQKLRFADDAGPLEWDTQSGHVAAHGGVGVPAGH